jgi:methionyl-tRNA synthetase
MVEKYRGGRIQPSAEGPGRLAAIGAEMVDAYRVAMDRFALDQGAAAAFRLIDAANEFIAETQPWALAKDPALGVRLDQVLHDVAEAIRLAALLLLPIMPGSAAEILRRVGAGEPAARLRLDRDGVWMSRERTVVKGDPLWPRLEPARP